MDVTYEKKAAMTFIGYHTEILPEEGYQKCPEFWNQEYSVKYARLLKTMKPENALEKAIIDHGIGMFGICRTSGNVLTYWIAGLYQGGEVPEGLELCSFPERQWAVFAVRGPLPESLQKVNTAVWQEWFPEEGKRFHADGTTVLEVYSPGNMQSPDYECEIWIPAE